MPLLSVSSARLSGTEENSLETPTSNPAPGALKKPLNWWMDRPQDLPQQGLSLPSLQLDSACAWDRFLPTNHLSQSLALILQRYLKWPRTDLLLHTIRVRILHECPFISVMSNTLGTHGLQPARLLSPYNSQAGIKWVAISYSRGSSQPMDQAQVSCPGRQILYHWAPGKPIGIWLASI